MNRLSGLSSAPGALPPAVLPAKRAKSKTLDKHSARVEDKDILDRKGALNAQRLTPLKKARGTLKFLVKLFIKSLWGFGGKAPVHPHNWRLSCQRELGTS